MYNTLFYKDICEDLVSEFAEYVQFIINPFQSLNAFNQSPIYMFYEKFLSKSPKISKRGEMENFVISAQIWDLNQVFVKSLTFFSQKTIGVANDTKNEL